MRSSLKTYLIALLAIACFGLSQDSIIAQNDTLVSLSSNTIGAKVLFVNYGYPNSIDSLRITNGIEILYMRNISKRIDLSIPLKVGVSHLPEFMNNRNFASADALIHFNFKPNDSKAYPYIFAGGGFLLENMDSMHVQIPAGLGLNIKIGEQSYLNFQAEYRYSMSTLKPSVQAGVGLLYRLGKGKSDSDKDGVPDVDDQCPDDPGTKELAGCPDSDLDGIADDADLCPDLPGTEELSGCPDLDGDGIADDFDDCPELAGSLESNGCPDSDEDGIPDNKDECPELAGDINGCPDSDNDGIIDPNDNCPDEFGSDFNNGCPDADSDGDGVGDGEDRCPNEVGTISTFGCPDSDGDGFSDEEDNCPDQEGEFDGCPDSDNDGLDDSQDRCPNEEGSISNNGCPEDGSTSDTDDYGAYDDYTDDSSYDDETEPVYNTDVDLTDAERATLDEAAQAVRFHAGTTRLRSKSRPLIDEIADLLLNNSSLYMIINGHSDSDGDPEMNLELSQDRAEACYDWLVSKGVDPNRLSYKGYGEKKPISNNNTERGRFLNRRVEFQVYEKEQ